MEPKDAMTQPTNSELAREFRDGVATEVAVMHGFLAVAVIAATGISTSIGGLSTSPGSSISTSLAVSRTCVAAAAYQEAAEDCYRRVRDADAQLDYELSHPDNVVDSPAPGGDARENIRSIASTYVYSLEAARADFDEATSAYLQTLFDTLSQISLSALHTGATGAATATFSGHRYSSCALTLIASFCIGVGAESLGPLSERLAELADWSYDRYRHLEVLCQELYGALSNVRNWVERVAAYFSIE